jgi:hypothetical protein
MFTNVKRKYNGTKVFATKNHELEPDELACGPVRVERPKNGEESKLTIWHGDLNVRDALYVKGVVICFAMVLFAILANRLITELRPLIQATTERIKLEASEEGASSSWLDQLDW